MILNKDITKVFPIKSLFSKLSLHNILASEHQNPSPQNTSYIMGDRDMNLKVSMLRSRYIAKTRFNRIGFLWNTLYYEFAILNYALDIISDMIGMYFSTP